MKKFLILFLILFMPVSAFADDSTGLKEGTYTLKRIIGPNTLQLANGEIIRLIGVNTSDVDGEGKKESEDFAKALVASGKTIKIEFDRAKRNADGQWLAYVYLPILYEMSPEGLALRDMGFLEPLERSLMPPDKSLNDGSNHLLFINAYIIASGYSQPRTVPADIKYVAFFEELYQDAIKNKRGLWK